MDNGSTSWFRYEGNENWIKEPSPFRERYTKGIYKANLDNNNTPDCIVFSGSNLQWLKYNTQKQWENRTIPINYGIDIISVGDINGDSFDDLACIANKYELSDEFTFSYKYSLITLENDQTGNFVIKSLYPISEINDIVLEDIDNDGDLDIITSSFDWLDGGIAIWRNIMLK